MKTIEAFANQEYKYGFTTNIESEQIAKGLNEDIIRLISAKKEEPDFMLEFRLKAFRHWQKLKEPDWANVNYPILFIIQLPNKKPNLKKVLMKLIQSF